MLCLVNRILVNGLPEGIAALRRDDAIDMVLFGERVTYKRLRRRLIEVSVSLNRSTCVSVRVCVSALISLAVVYTSSDGYMMVTFAFLLQVVLSHESPMIGKQLGDALFSTLYDATPSGLRVSRKLSSVFQRHVTNTRTPSASFSLDVFPDTNSSTGSLTEVEGEGKAVAGSFLDKDDEVVL
jgi:hypothetical protein